MVRRKIDIKLIANKSYRHTTFTKRRKGLMNKTEEFCKVSDSKGIVISFSDAGNCFCLGHPDVGSVLNNYLGDSSSAIATEAEKIIGDALESGKWVEAVKGLRLDGLDRVYVELENATRKLEALAAAKEETQSYGRRD
ncbi:hypothetical protein SASPL_143283 [Salvia splendens]|uniref:MADS-box domain-containing protein n=1 Tax=Salvia splendens TaxID=180675 RepID=A0A8X8WNC6_SALSN|nr:agamous-like MADS-box protein AGL23 [Salvia splendens]KAG6397119.1 hypothetical protein SASPL_143283 [Salvia splendens]